MAGVGVGLGGAGVAGRGVGVGVARAGVGAPDAAEPVEPVDPGAAEAVDPDDAALGGDLGAAGAAAVTWGRAWADSDPAVSVTLAAAAAADTVADS